MARLNASNLPVTVDPSPEEVTEGQLGPRNLEKAVRALHEDGLVVISKAIPHDDLDHLNVKMVDDA